MIRYYILHGDCTTSDGIVVASATDCFNNGRALARIGDDINCRKCGTVGKIAPKGPRLKDFIHDREVALSGDICLCNCSPPPVLVNSREDMRQIITAEEAARQGFGPNGTPIATPREALIYDQQFQLLHGNTKQPLENTRYKIVSPSGVITAGVTDSSGMTSRVTTTAAETLHLYTITVD